MQGLSLQQQQKLLTRLSPEQIQVVKMLEIPAMELQQRVNEELQDNPALEEGKEEHIEELPNGEDYEQEEEYDNPLQNDDFNYDNYVEDDETPDYRMQTHNYSADDEHEQAPITGSTTFMEYLKSQVYLTKMTKPERHIAKWVLGNIDADGYLRRTTEQLVDDLSFQEGLTVSEQQMQAIVDQIKLFDPAGVASANLQECLLAQLEQKKPTPEVQHAIGILREQFEDFVKRKYERVQEKLGLSEQEMKEAVNEILHLNQKPANAFNGNIYENQETTIIPDFYVEEQDGELVISLNSGDIPELHVSADYTQMLDSYSKQERMSKEAAEAAKFIRSKIDSAKWFIQAIAQRNETLLRTMSAIVEMQKEFFLEGDAMFLKPMILQDIADRTGYDISTISRVSNSKYVQTEFGLFPLKYFFSEGMTNNEGEEVSTREIKDAIVQIIAKEDKSAPFNDDQIVDELDKIGFTIARRTVAKYRDAMHIPTARLRKQV